MAKRTYINESHRRYSESCQRAVDEMKKHPLTHEQLREQMRRNREEHLRRVAEEMEHGLEEDAANNA